MLILPMITNYITNNIILFVDTDNVINHVRPYHLDI
jgi:hypothetical protein